MVGHIWAVNGNAEPAVTGLPARTAAALASSGWLGVGPVQLAATRHGASALHAPSVPLR